jgi:DNA mismatch endonuclease (patch repair protein)
LPKHRTVVFVHGCFWHRCPHCAVGSQRIRTNLVYWLPKLERNLSRDAKAQRDLSAAGWRSFIVWECQIGNQRVLAMLVDRLKSTTAPR